MKKWMSMFGVMAVFLIAAPVPAIHAAEQTDTATAQPSSGSDQTNPAPMAKAREAVFNFDPVPDGTQIVHDFIIENKGTADLFIKKVHTG